MAPAGVPARPQVLAPLHDRTWGLAWRSCAKWASLVCPSTWTPSGASPRCGTWKGERSVPLDRSRTPLSSSAWTVPTSSRALPSLESAKRSATRALFGDLVKTTRVGWVPAPPCSPPLKPSTRTLPPCPPLLPPTTLTTPPLLHLLPALPHLLPPPPRPRPSPSPPCSQGMLPLPLRHPPRPSRPLRHLDRKRTAHRGLTCDLRVEG
mmetsp:Transcript_4172/g.12323  ORF Transcript_4172/g.12323 Transcript_4172/m.12323 type:complete len:207 (+) Transcript_4172:913-1533(+)